LGIWEKIHNPYFNVTEFRNIKNQSGSNDFVLTAKHYDFVFVDEESFNKYTPKSFDALIKGFNEYRE
jgi:hypothetical protein